MVNDKNIDIDVHPNVWLESKIHNLPKKTKESKIHNHYFCQK